MAMELEFETGESLGTKRQFLIYGLVNVLVALASWYLFREYKQTVATSIFMALVIGTLMFWKFRVALAFLGVAVLLITGTIDLEHTIEFMSVDVIIFLAGMMVMVGVLRKAGFFRWLLARCLALSGFRPKMLLLMFLLISAVMAALVGEVISILFICALIIDFCDFFKVNPVKYIISAVFATNVGSSWTVLGNPVGILIALRSDLTFEDFIKVAFPAGLVVLAVMIVILMVWQRGDLRKLSEQTRGTTPEQRKTFLAELATVNDRSLFMGSSIIFGIAVILLALHYRLELSLGLQSNTLLVAISMAGAGVVMMWKRGMAHELITREVDWWTLIFFMFLFAKAGALKYVGVTDVAGEALMNLTGGGEAGAVPNLALLITLVLWITGITSAGLDNVVVVATLIPVIQYIAPVIESESLWWALLFGACFGGNMTMVGSTANIVALGLLESRKGYHMTFTKWIYIGLVGSLVPMAVATVYLLLIS